MIAFLQKSHTLQRLVFLFIALVLSLLFVGSVLRKGPGNTHMWRQTDCLSITKKYQDGATFLEPEMHIQLAEKLQSGKSAGEFPLVYWTIGNIWKRTGQSHLVYRLIYLVILIGGVYSLFLLTQLYFSSFFWSALLALCLFFSPVYAYYSVSFLTDGPALAFALMGSYFTAKYFIDKKKSNFVYAMLLFALVGLLKISSLIVFVFILCLFVLERLGYKLTQKHRLFQNKFFEYLGFVAVLAIIVAWYVYADWYNKQYEFKYTFNHIFPFWLTDQYDFASLMDNIKNQTLLVFINKWTLIVLAAMWLFNLFRFGKVERIYSLINLIIPIGAFMYIALWFPLFGVHDYYYMPLVILLPAVILPFFMDLKSNFHNIFHHRYFKVGVLAFFGLNFLYTHQISEAKTGKLKGESNPIIDNAKFVGFMNWANSDVGYNIYQYYRIREHLEEMGIKSSSKVIVLSDNSFNTSLYLLNRNGWTNFMKFTSIEEIIRLKEQHGAEFLFIHKEDLAEHAYVYERYDEPDFQFENLYIYRLK